MKTLFKVLIYAALLIGFLNLLLVGWDHFYLKKDSDSYTCLGVILCFMTYFAYRKDLED